MPQLAAQESDEQKFFKEAITKLNAYATLCDHNGYPKKAKEVWLEIVAEYDPNDDVARRALGYVRVGSSWAPDPKHEKPKNQDKLDPAVARLLQNRWTDTAKFLADGHKKLGQLLAKSDEKRAKYHMDRALRFNPADADAGAATGTKNFEGFFGTDVEIAILKRSRLINRRVGELAQKTYPVEPLPAGSQQRHVQRANIAHKGFKSANFTIWGNYDDDVLKEAAMNAERALAFCNDVWAGVPGYPHKAPWSREFVFLTSREQYHAVLDANANLFSGDALQFTKANTSATALEGIRIAGTEHAPGVHDLAVRWVVHGFSGYRSDALIEGIGHAVVGTFFGRNLTFTIGQHKKKGGFTVSGKEEDPRLLLPDVEAWSELAMEAAYEKTSTSAAKLPLLKAASFPDDGRIKAWAFCDYMLRRDPAQLVVLDRCMSAGNENAVREKFATDTGGQILDSLDEAWRRFWTEDTPLLRAVKGKITPLEAVSKNAVEWLEAFNKVRRELPGLAGVNGVTLPEVGWSASYSGDCKAHAEYLKQNATERGPAAEQQQKVNLKGATNPGRTFAPQALVNTQQGKPEKIVEGWLDWPGYRDALLKQHLQTIGLYVDGQILVMDVTKGLQSGGQVPVFPYPWNGQKNVPTEVEVKPLGPEIATALKKHGKETLKVLGYPLTYHLQGKLPDNRASIRCEIMQGKDKVDGFLFFGGDGNNRRSSAPGLLVFFPWEPLRRGSEYTVLWAWEGGGMREPGRFLTK